MVESLIDLYESWIEMDYDEMTSKILFYIGIYGTIVVFFMTVSILIFAIRKRFEKKTSSVQGARHTNPLSGQELLMYGVIVFALAPLCLCCFGLMAGGYYENWILLSVSVVGGTVFGSFTSIASIIIIGMVCLQVQADALEKKKSILKD